MARTENHRGDVEAGREEASWEKSRAFTSKKKENFMAGFEGPPFKFKVMGCKKRIQIKLLNVFEISNHSAYISQINTQKKARIGKLTF